MFIELFFNNFNRDLTGRHSSTNPINHAIILAKQYLDDVGKDLLIFNRQEIDKNFFESDFFVKRTNTYYPKIKIPLHCYKN